MERRSFLQLLAAVHLGRGTDRLVLPKYEVVSSYPITRKPGMPGPYPGEVVSVRSAKCIDEKTNQADAGIVREMMASGISTLTGQSNPGEAWRTLFDPSDVVGIKVNPIGGPHVVSSPEIVAEVVRNLLAVGLKPNQIYLYERFRDRLDQINYPAHLPAGIRTAAGESHNGWDSWARDYDPATYVEVNFFGEEDTRSNLMRLVTERLTKIINIPTMKDHGASGVTGCLKNIAYGSFSNVARSHQHGMSHTYSFIGTLAAVEPLRSRTILEIMDGLRGVWHCGPGAPPRFCFFPKRILFGTDPVALDTLLLDIIDSKRKAEGAISIWNRSEAYLRPDGRERDKDPNVNILIREPGHVEYASQLGLGVGVRNRIRVKEVEI